MPGFVGMLVGGTLGMLFLGHLAAWVIRKISGLANIASYVIGVSLMTFVGAWSVTYDGRPNFLENWIVYVISGAIALSLMIIRDRRKQRQVA